MHKHAFTNVKRLVCITCVHHAVEWLTTMDINWGHNCEHGVDSPEYTVLQDTHHGNTTITRETDACCADMLFAKLLHPD
jgi:hypothetical protein